MIRSDQQQRAYAFLLMARQYLGLAHQASRELVDSRNPTGAVFDADEQDWAAKFSEMVRWADHSVGVAILFNALHGVELVLKGFLVAKTHSYDQTHQLLRLRSSLESAYGQNLVGVAIDDLFGHMTNLESPFATFLNKNAITLDQWYEALKYPERLSSMPLDHFCLKFGGDKAIGYWKSLSEMVARIHNAALRQSRVLGL